MSSNSFGLFCENVMEGCQSGHHEGEDQAHWHPDTRLSPRSLRLASSQNATKVEIRRKTSIVDKRTQYLNSFLFQVESPGAILPIGRREAGLVDYSQSQVLASRCSTCNPSRPPSETPSTSPRSLRPTRDRVKAPCGPGRK